MKSDSPTDSRAETIDFSMKRLPLEGSGREDLVVRALQECQVVIDTGKLIDRSGMLQKYPEIRDELSQCLDGLELMCQPASGGDSQVAAKRHHPAVSPLATLGDFRVLREIGRGGMGVVYEAEQLSIGRNVALKVLPYAAMLDKKQIARFLNEARAAATLEHPHIVRVYFVGNDRGVYYYAMRLIDGQDLSEILAELRDSTGDVDNQTAPLGQIASSLTMGLTMDLNEGRSLSASVSPDLPGPPSGNHDPTVFSRFAQSDQPMAKDETVDDSRHGPQAGVLTDRSIHPRVYYQSIARLVCQIAEALDFAHASGVVHRDVKPANIMLDPTGKAWITDFGLARLDSDIGMTMTGDLVGTLRYMSPEQILAKRMTVDHRTDVYSLGATLYELLTLQPLFDGNDRAALLQQIANEEPKRPGKVAPSVPSDLETIVLKTLEKNPDDRYRTAQELADDLQRYLDQRPIHARLPSLTNRLVKWSRRHVGVVWTLALASLVLVVVLGVSTTRIAASRNRAEQQHKAAKQQQTLAEQQRNEARRNQYYAEMVAGQTEVASPNAGGLYEQLVPHLPVPGEEDHRDWEWYYLMSRCRPEIRTLVYPGLKPFAAWSPDGQTIGAPGAIWQANTGARIRLFNTSNIMRYRVAWSPDGKKFAWAVAADENAIYIWDRSTDNISRLAGHESSVWCVAWSPDGSQLASGSIDETIKIWDVATNTVQWTSPEIGNHVMNLAWSPDGKLLAAGLAWAGGIQVWDVAQRKLHHKRPGPGTNLSVSWHPQGNVLAVGEDESWYLLKRDDWSVVHQEPISRGGQAIAYSPDGAQIAVTHGETVTVWDSSGETKLAELNGHRRPVVSVSWSPEGRRLVTADETREIKLWDLDRHDQPPPIDAGVEIESIAWHDDNQTLVTVAHDDGSLAWWDSSTGSLKRREDLTVKRPFQLSPDRKLAAVPREDAHALSILDASSGETHSVLRLDPKRELRSYAFSGDGSRMTIQTEADENLFLEVWDIDKEQLVWIWQSERTRGEHGSASGPLKLLTWADGRTRIAAVGFGDRGENGSTYWRDHLHVFDAALGKRIFKHLPVGRDAITALAWSWNGQFVALGTADGRLEVVDAENGRRRFTQKIHREGVSALAWHPAGNRLASASRDGEVKLATAGEGNVLLSFSMPQGYAVQLAWSGDGQRLAASTSRRQVHIWDAGRAYEIVTASPRRGELAWAYRGRADRSSGEIRRGALHEFLRLAPDTLDFWEDRGRAYAQLGQFDRAFAEFSKGIEPDMQYAFTATRNRAYALLGAGHDDRYREACARLVEVFRESPVPSNRGHVAWLCALTSNPLVDSPQVLAMARANLDTDEDPGDMGKIYVGACLYRDGQYDSAVRTLTELAAKLERGGDSNEQYLLAYAQYFLALARFDMGHAFQARRLLSKANHTADELPRHLSRWYWMRLVELDTLRREATSVIGK